MKRIITISAAVVLGTLMFNVALAQAGDSSKVKHDHDSKHFKYDDHCKDYWRDYCYDYGYDCNDYWYGYEWFNFYGYGCDNWGSNCDHGGKNNGSGLPVIGNNPPGVPPHEGPKPFNPGAAGRGGSGIFTVDGNLGGSKPINTSATDKAGTGTFTVYGQGKKGNGQSSPNRPAPKK